MPELAPRRYRLIVFDWDGTLADSTALIAGALRAACVEVGRPMPSEADARYVIGLGLADALAHVAPGLTPDEQRLLASHYRRHYLGRETTIPLFDGACALLSDLDDAGFLLGVATGKTRVGLDRSIARTGLHGRFHATRCADEGLPKPHPDMLLALMDRLAVEPRDTLMVGDTTHDLDLARNAGAQAVAVAYGAHDTEGLAAHRPLATVHSIAELRTWLATNA
ncbi:phosphoglycolate phosphatase [Burkholderiales bacterium]|nr:phosphoglycolate phosphatase [Burkholderiales bacterium]